MDQIANWTWQEIIDYGNAQFKYGYDCGTIAATKFNAKYTKGD